ncbi:MAG: alpha-amylase family glycosyl hydrolase [Thermodesulfobacteriota bacterium]
MWSDEVVYFLLVDRFSDGGKARRNTLDRGNLSASRPKTWSWQNWATSGGDRYQGGTIAGVAGELEYLQEMGVSTIWLSPVFKQRGHLNTYHGYGIQDFFDVEPRFGSRADLVDLVQKAHDKKIRVLLDIIFNHSGHNWDYQGNVVSPGYNPSGYPFGNWLDQGGGHVPAIASRDDGVWPKEFQNSGCYSRCGVGSLDRGEIEDPLAEHKRTDFCDLRDFNLTDAVLSDLARCYMYWIALTDCDGFRIDTLKHVTMDQARNFCGAIKEFAASLGKNRFLLLGEIAGGDYGQSRYLDVLGRNLDAALDIGSMRIDLGNLAKGLVHPGVYFNGFETAGRPLSCDNGACPKTRELAKLTIQSMGSHRNLGDRHISIIDDHDHVFGRKTRFASDSSTEQQSAAAVALQLFTLGIPCIYYGTEQSLGRIEDGERKWLPADYGSSDRYLRETMFGADHPLMSGVGGISGQTDNSLPGFGPCGTVGSHCFDRDFHVYRRIKAMTELRRQYPALRHGRQYLRETSFLGYDFRIPGPGELLAWSRILADEEAVCILNVHGNANRGADVVVDASLNPVGGSLTVVLNTAQTAYGAGNAGGYAVGTQLPVLGTPSGRHFVQIRNLPPSEMLVLVRDEKPRTGGLR